MLIHEGMDLDDLAEYMGNASVSDAEAMRDGLLARGYEGADLWSIRQGNRFLLVLGLSDDSVGL